MTADLEPAARALGLLRLVLVGDGDVGRQLVDELEVVERRDVADVLERMAAAVAGTILDLVADVGPADPVHAAEAVAVLLGASAWLDGVEGHHAEAAILRRVDHGIRLALDLEAG